MSIVLQSSLVNVDLLFSIYYKTRKIYDGLWIHDGGVCGK